MDNNKKILLLMLPFWTPQIPPLGLACLKAFLSKRDFNVRTVDLNTDISVKKFYNEYFNLLMSIVPSENQGNIHNIGHEILQAQLISYLNCDKIEYYNLVRMVVQNTFFYEISKNEVNRLSKVVENYFEWFRKAYTALILEEKPDVVGFSMLSGNVATTVYAGKITKKILPNSKVLVGGGAFTKGIKGEDTGFDLFVNATKEFIDHYFIGEGELLLYNYLTGKLDESERVSFSKKLKIDDLILSNAGTPDFTDFNIDKYLYLSMFSSRSCVYNCDFCAETIYWGKYRKKNITQVFEELKYFSEKYKRKLFLFGDSLLNPVISQLSEKIKGMGNPPMFYFDGYLKVDNMGCDIDIVKLWRDGGLYRARLGIESGSQRILEKMNKRITLDQIRLVLKNLSDMGIKTTTYWIVGYPGETADDYQATLDLLTELKDYIYEAECNTFKYYNHSFNDKENGAVTNKVHSDIFNKYLMNVPWSLNTIPSRETTYKRAANFTHLCSKLGISNPYSLNDLIIADKRWHSLHENAVPGITDMLL